METATTTEWKLDEPSGQKYCEDRPENTRVAKLEDFYTDGELELNPQLILNKPFITESYKDGKFWASRTKEGFPYPWSDFMTFLENNRVYIFESKII